MRTAITVSLVSQARGGPFVFWDDLEASCAEAAAIGFDAVEIFPPSVDAIAPEFVLPIVKKHGLAVAAVGTGAGWVAHRLHFVHEDAAVRAKALEFAAGIVRAAAALGAPAIIGSMQGRAEGGVSREQALEWLGEAMVQLGTLAGELGQPVFLEPLNRYETNLFHRVADVVQFLNGLSVRNVLILADLFHMNIEESSIADAIREAGPLIGHFHFADSNRKAVGLGHTAIEEVAAALVEIGYGGYLSAEVLSLPDATTAARQSFASMRKYLPN